MGVTEGESKGWLAAKAEWRVGAATLWTAGAWPRFGFADERWAESRNAPGGPKALRCFAGQR